MHTANCVCGGCGKKLLMWEVEGDQARFWRSEAGVWVICSKACVTSLAGVFAQRDEQEAMRTVDQVQNSPFRLEHFGNSIPLGVETLRCASCESPLEWSFVPHEQRFYLQPCTSRVHKPDGEGVLLQRGDQPPFFVPKSEEGQKEGE